MPLDIVCAFAVSTINTKTTLLAFHSRVSCILCSRSSHQHTRTHTDAQRGISRANVATRSSLDFHPSVWRCSSSRHAGRPFRAFVVLWCCCLRSYANALCYRLACARNSSCSISINFTGSPVFMFFNSFNCRAPLVDTWPIDYFCFMNMNKKHTPASSCLLQTFGL